MRTQRTEIMPKIASNFGMYLIGNMLQRMPLAKITHSDVAANGVQQNDTINGLEINATALMPEKPFLM